MKWSFYGIQKLQLLVECEDVQQVSSLPSTWREGHIHYREVGDLLHISSQLPKLYITSTFKWIPFFSINKRHFEQVVRPWLTTNGSSSVGVTICPQRWQTTSSAIGWGSWSSIVSNEITLSLALRLKIVQSNAWFHEHVQNRSDFYDYFHFSFLRFKY